MIENEMTVSVPLEVVKASEIEPKEVKWLWYPYIPVGKVTLLQGDPGDGKSKLMLSIAALLSKGEPLPFTETEENEPMTIIYQTTEDDADDTVVPRFNSAGGNGENLIFIKEDEKSFPGSFGGAGGVSLPGPLSVTGCSGVFVVLSSAISIYLLFFGMKKEAQLFSQAPVGSSSFLRHDTKIPPVVSFGRYFV